jgi:hypothetical protein
VPPTAEREFRGSARFQLRRRIGAGAEAEARLRAQLVVDPRRLAATLAPGYD